MSTPQDVARTLAFVATAGNGEPPLGAPAEDGSFLTSTIAGVRSWLSWTGLKANLKAYFDSLYLGIPAMVALSPEGGVLVKLVNRTGAISVKGSVLSISELHEASVTLQSAEFDAACIMYSAGVAEGAECWVVVSGVAEVLLKDGTAATAGYWSKCADTDGRAEVTTPPAGVGAVTLSEHFKEVGHCLETKAAGTDVLAKLVIHFN